VTPVDVALVRRKLARILRNLDQLGAVEPLTLEEYTADEFRLKGVEKMLQEVVEAAADANLHLLRDVGRAPPDYYSSFLDAGRAGIITSDLGRVLALPPASETGSSTSMSRSTMPRCCRRWGRHGCTFGSTSRRWRFTWRRDGIGRSESLAERANRRTSRRT
jgi:hypothetical protein